MTSKLFRITGVFMALAFILTVGLATISDAQARPPARPKVWANGVLYNAVVPQSPNGAVQFPHVPDGTAPAASGLETTDDLYIVASNAVTPLVSDAAPGDSDYNGGRWLPRMVTATGAGQVPELTSEEEIVAAATAGLVTISGPGGFFECPITSRVRS